MWAQAPFDKWNGTAPAIPANTNVATVNDAGIQGDGTQASPFLIKNANDFVFFWTAANNGKITSSTQYWRLEANIDLDNKAWTYVDKNCTFKGKFDGNGKTIKNMKLAPPTKNLNYGLFCVVEGQAADNRAEVKNLTIDNATIAPSAELDATTTVGFAVGKSNKYADIINVTVTNSTITYSKNIKGNQYVGGIVGQTNTDTKVQNCSVTTLGITTSGTTTNAYFGGLIGYINSQTAVTNCSTSDVTITYNAIANASRISGLVGFAQGTSETAKTTIKDCSVSGTNINLKAGINNGSCIGALLAQSGKSTVLGDGTDDNKNTVATPTITIGGEVKAASYIGGAIGDFAGGNGTTSNVDKLVVTSPKITVNKYTTATSYTGGVFGRVSTYADVNDVTLSGTTLKFTTDLGCHQQIGTFAGTITGNSTQQVPVKNITIDASTLTFGSSNTSNTVSVRAGLIGHVTSNVLLDTWTITGNSAITVNGNLATTGSRIGGFVGSIEPGDAIDNKVIIRDVKMQGTSSISVTGNITAGSNLGGFVGYAIGRSKDNTTVTLQNVSLATSNITVTGQIKAPSYIGGLGGYMATAIHLKKCNIAAAANININGEVNTASSFFGGAIGNIQGATGYPSVIEESGTGLKDAMSITKPTVTVDKINYKECYVGSVFGRVNTFTTINDVTVSNPTTTYNNNGNPNIEVRIGSFAGGIIGNAAQETSVSGIKVTGTATLNLGTGSSEIKNARAGLVGYVDTNVNMDDWTIDNTKVDVKGSLTTTASNIGGIVGYAKSAANAPVTINNINVTGSDIVSVSGNVTVTSCNVGTAFGYLQGIVTANPIRVNNITIKAPSLTFGTTTSNNTVGLRAGILGYIYQNVSLDTWTVTGNTLTINGNLITTASNVGGFVGYAAASENAPISIQHINFSGAKNFTVTNKVSIASQLGGFVGNVLSANNAPVTIDDVNMTDGTNTVTITGNIASASQVGGFAGYLKSAKTNAVVNADVNVNNVRLGTTNVTISADATVDKVSIGGIAGQMNAAKLSQSSITGATISIDGNLTNNIFVGGIVGQMEANTYNTIVERCNITASKIKTAASAKTFAKSKMFAFGGVVGYAPQSTTTFSLVRSCVAEVDIDLSNLAPLPANISGQNYNLQQNGLVVGGIIGRIDAPIMLPEFVYYSGKINAPLAAVGPTVGVFHQKIGAATYLYDDYSGVNATTVTAAEWEKAKTWYYNRYKIALSSDLTTQSARTSNYTGTPAMDGSVNYLEITDAKTAFTKSNFISNIDKLSRTILAYDVNNKNQDYGIYPQWNTGSVTYPKYYMYYMQGVNRGEYVDNATAATLKAGILAGEGSLINMELRDENGNLADNANRGVIEHTLRVLNPTSTVDSYKWYVDDVVQGGKTADTFSVTPDIAGNTISVEAIIGGKVAKKLYLRLQPVLRVKEPTATTFGTKNNPYLIGNAKELQLMSYLSTLPTNVVWEKTYISSTHYNKAYYELDGDIDLSSIDDFTPISFFKSNDTGGTISGYHQNFVFDGVFDGKMHTISGLKETWYAGAYNTNDQNMAWGLFAVVGNNTLSTKVGDAQASSTAIRNLIIDGAVLTHKTANTSFYYNNGNSGNSNNCMVGVLAGIVSNNVIIENIKVSNSSITDASSSAFSLAVNGLSVGGVIGSVQNRYNEEKSTISNTRIQSVVAEVNITLTNPTFSSTDQKYVSRFNIGGIIGRYCTTSATITDVQKGMPKYTLFTGTINAPKAWISPVIGAVRTSEQNSLSYGNFSKIWEGNNNTAATQLVVQNALYRNYKIHVDTEDKLITDEYPENECNLGARSIMEHKNATEAVGTYNAQKYQGVNFNAQYVANTDDAKFDVLSLFNSNTESTVAWSWNSGNVPSFDSGETNYARLSRGVNDKINEFTLATDVEHPTITWQVRLIKDGAVYEDVVGVTTNTCTVEPDKYYNKSVRAIVNGTIYSQSLVVNREDFDASVSISRTEADGNYNYTLNLGGTSYSADDHNITYRWYVPTAPSTSLSTTNAYSHATSVHNSRVYCDVIITDKTTGVVMFSETAEYLTKKVVYLQLNTGTVTASNETTYTYRDKTADSRNGLADYGYSPTNPVTTWADAYDKLDGYTEPTETFVIGNGGTWNSATEYNIEEYYLDHKADYPYDVYKRNGDKRKVKPIEECTVNWNTNIIVLMGLSNDGYFNYKNNIDGEKANKPVTITGKYDDVNYYGYISHSSSDFSINADHKFENMGLGVSDGKISDLKRYRIYAHRWNIYAGKGLLMGWAAAEAWGESIVPVTDDNKNIYKVTLADGSTGTPDGEYAADIAIMGGFLNDNTSANSEMNDYINHGRDDIGQQITIESGFWGPVCPGNRQTDGSAEATTYFVMGGPDHPAKTTITIDIDREWNDAHRKYHVDNDPATVDVGCLLSGNHEGTMYADVTLNLKSGNVGRVVNGIKGSQRRNHKTNAFTTEVSYVKHYRHTVYDTSGKEVEVNAPAPDSYFGRGVINVIPNGEDNSKVSVVELYCGGLGRSHNDGSKHPEVCTYFYGLSEVNIKGGTFKKTIFGAGAGGVNGIGTRDNHTDDNALPYWNTGMETPTNGKTPHVWYAPYDYIKKVGRGSSREGSEYNFVKVKASPIVNVGDNETYTDTNLEDGYVNLENTRNVINITGGIFGDKEHPVSIYGGGYGEVNPALINPHSSAPAGAKNTSNTPNHQAGNMYGAAEGYTSEINISGNAEIFGNIYGGGKGSPRYYRYFTRTAATTYADAFQEYSRYYNVDSKFDSSDPRTSSSEYSIKDGNEWKQVQNLRQNADAYLNLGQIYGNTKLSISGNVKINGNVYGGGEGVADEKADNTADGFFGILDAQLGLSAASTITTVMGYTGTSSGRRTNEIAKDGSGKVTDSHVAFVDMGKITGNAEVEISGDVVIRGSVYGGGQAGAVTGNSAISIMGNAEVYGKVYGAGKGLLVDEAKAYRNVAYVAGNTKVTLGENAIIWQDMFGGGQNAIVKGDTYFNMEGGHVAADVFAGGEGNIKKDNEGAYVRNEEALVVTSADILGNTNIDITGGEIVWNRTSLSEPHIIVKHIFKKEIGEGEGAYLDIKTFTDEDLKKAGTTIEAKKTELSEYDYSSETNTIASGEVVYWNPDNQSLEDNTVVGDKKYYNSLFYDTANKRFKIKHNIFGGGSVACRVGTYVDGKLSENTGNANVSMESGMFGATLIGTEQWKECYNDNQDPHFYVFGGGFGAYTSVGNTKLKIGVDSEIEEYAGETDQQWAKPNRLKLGASDDTHGAKAKGMMLAGYEDDLPIADQSYGEPGYTILGILGGGFAGIVTGNTDVHVGGNTFMHRIYGGGYGQLAAYNELNENDVIWSETVGGETTDYMREDLGMVMGNTYVKTDGGFIQGDVFGGGAGVESAWLDGTTYKELDNTNTTAVKDFTMGEVKGATDVEIAGTTFVQRSVFGGGDVANVLGGTVGTGENAPQQTSTVTVKSGTVVANVFGGGSGRSVSLVNADAVADNAVPVGKIVGETLVTIEDTKNEETGEVTSSPEIYGGIYGGGAYGQITSNTHVNINGGNIGGDIYGGGLGDIRTVNGVGEVITSANIAGSTNVTVNGGSALWSVVADDNGNKSLWEISKDVLTDDADKLAVRLALVTGDTQIFKKLLAGKVSDKFFNVETLEFTKNHNIYGGGDLVCKVAGTANVTINHALVTDATLLDPSNSAGLCWAASIDNKEHPQFSVFGGGYGPNTTVANTEVKYQCGHIELYTSTDPEVTAGTKVVGDLKFTYESQEADRTVWAKYFGKMALDWADLDAKEKEQNYGGNNSAGIWRYAVSQLAWSSGIPNLIMRGVFGGGYAGLVEGNTNVIVSDNSCMRYVYGGGLGSKDYLDRYSKDNATNLYNRLGEVGGNSTVTITGGVVSKELYGGGAGIEPKKLSEDTYYTDLVDMARVIGKTSVSISGSPSITPEGARGTVIIGDVFGGGDVANVGMADANITGTNPNDVGFITSKVIINSGCMLGQVFAGGNGRTKEICSGADANGVFGYQKVGAIFGNTLLSVDGYDATSSVGPETDTHGKGVTYIFKRMFGGGNNGSIRKTTGTGGAKYSGHTYVTVNGGFFAYNVFGGGVGSIGDVEENNTYSYVEGDTHVKMLGGLAIVDQYWDKPQSIEVAPGKTIEVGLRQWAPLNEFEGKKYSAQYDPVQKKLLINHNVYAGCRNAGYVLGSTYLTMNKGYIRSGLRAGAYDDVPENFFDSKEWEEIYNKIGSPHFCIFGGGFGENTHIMGNTYVDINIDAVHAGLTSPVTLSPTIMNEPVPAKRFEGGQSVMDIIGGGYSGDVAGATHVKVSGDVFARRVFGGSFYAPVSQTNILINSIYCDDIFGGGMMGNVEETTVMGYHLESGCGNVNLVIGKNNSEDNKKIFISNNVFGGNDVSGVVRGQISNSILGGTIYNNVYGAGNGNYLYAINQTVNKVTTHENYEANGQTYPLVYEVPKREEMQFSMQSATNAQKIVNINTYRPNAQKVLLNIGGSAADNMLTIKGNVFGGGNTATVNNLDGNTANTSVVMNIGSHCNIGGVYMGNDGDAMFQEENGFMDAFQKINGVDLTQQIKWLSNPMDRQIAELYLPVKLNDRPTIYPHVLDLYFQPVEMSLQPTLNWCSAITKATAEENLTVTPTVSAAGLTNTTIGIFVAGGNRGNMNVTPIADGDDEGRIVNYEFPAGLTITNRIVGGCNNANYTLGKTTHVGGYLLGKRNTTNPAIDLSVMCKFGLAEGVDLLSGNNIPKDSEGNPLEQRNVYGGCYNSGTINGDINIDFRSTMLNADNIGTINTKEACDNIAKTYFGSEVAMGNVYGAGYGSESYVYGNTKVTVGQPVTPTASKSSSAKGMKKAAMEAGDEYVAMSVYGGGQKGNVIGNTTVRVLNGHIGKSVVGGSYAGYMWGSTQVIVGYPTYYTANKGGIYKMARADKWNTEQTHHDGSKVVKEVIYVLPGDVISQEVYDAIKDYDTHNSTNQYTQFTKHVETPTASLGFTNGWKDIKITIDEACYGGGYSLASGSSVAAGTYTVKKYDETMNITKDYDLDDMKEFVNHAGNTSTKGYGGNTTVLVWDNNAVDQTKDHINISTQTMKEVVLPNGTDLFGYYHLKDDGSYGYIYQEGEYFYGTGSGSGTYYTQAFESDSEGGMYGDGHLSFAEGFRAGELVGYGFSGDEPNGAKIINTFQRMDMLRLKDCSVAVLGARDYTVNEISKTPYSLARIGELQMVAENVKNAADGIFMTAGGNLAATTTPRSRNYLGLSNNIHYLGAVKSNVDFNSTYHYGNKDAGNSIGTAGTKTYREIKQDYVTNDIDNPAEFQKRNDGTAANMIGISSGYAMKVQNVFTEGPTAESFFYGPIVGVVEMNLIDVREDEGGGYVYADNVHHRPAAVNYSNGNYDQVPNAPDQTEDFLETSGNFVFPYDVQKNRYIVDDCFPTGFDERTGDKSKATAEAHYWYVTGYNYYYNAHITGYTYNSEGEMLTFNSDKDGLLTLTGAKVGQTINLQSLKWRSNHAPNKDGDGFVACDLETVKEPGDKAAGYGNKVLRQEDANGKISGDDGAGSVFEHYNYNHYNLHITTDNVNPTVWNNLPLTTSLGASQTRGLSGNLTKADPVVTFQLTDMVDNSGIDYYNKYMKQPSQATVVLTCPATDKLGNTVKGYVPISFFFTAADNSTKLADGTDLTPGNTYYYFGNGNDFHQVNSNDLLYYNKSIQRYVPVNKSAFTLAKYKELEGNESMTQTEYDALPDFVGTLESGGQTTFYDYDNRLFTYTIYLTIDYVQGPDVSGNLKIYNCALPGEKIKIDKGTIDIKSDVSMSQTAAIWRFSKDDKVYDFDQNNPFDEEASTNNTSEMLKDVEYSESDNCIYVPAYYFMNGYKVAYWYRVNGIEQEFSVPSSDNDYLTIHNYHRMLPRAANGKDKASVDFKLDEAQKRIKAETTAANEMPESTEEERIAKAAALEAILPEPRIYVADAADLNELPRFLNEKANTYYEDYEEFNTAKATSLTPEQFAALPSTKKIKGDAAVGTKYDFGSHMQFHLLNDITLKTEQEDIYNAPVKFKGTLHGNGYVLSGLGVTIGDHTPSGYLFSTNEGDIYNLGLKNGVITKDDEPVNGTTYPLYHTSYTWADKTVYRMDGTAVATTADGAGNTYTNNDWRYGKVTYDINQYYLEARKAKLNSTADAQHYVEDLYHNGDYLYARWQSASPEYLRTTASQYDANYNSATSYHYFNFDQDTYQITHNIDEDRKVDVEAVLYANAAEYNAAKSTSLDDEAFAALPVAEKTKTPASFYYKPLFEETSVGHTGESAKITRNDFVFFGQDLNAATKKASLGEVNMTIPDHIDADRTHNVALMDNRVYRAGGYYESNAARIRSTKKNDADAYTASGGVFLYNADGYIHDNGITAIDFYGYKEPVDVDGCRYNPVIDYNLTDLGRADGVTRNLLVYAHSAADVVAADIENDIPAGLLRKYVYTESTVEGDVKMHVITPKEDQSGEVKAETPLLHLVERTSADKDASGVDCLNNDFDAPIAFDVTERAWYTRQPALYAENNNDAWEGITLPFTANKVEASLNGEITHFYGTPTEAQKSKPDTNDKTLHHEYWLRGLTGVADSKATFQRPGDGLFTQGSETISSYVFTNNWFVETYDGLDYNWSDPSEQNNWYDIGVGKTYETGHTYADYKPLTANIPYIVSFPGNRFYEFDLSSKFYNDKMDASKPEQTVTFNHNGATTISVTNGSLATTDAGGYSHTPTFVAIDDAAYGINVEEGGKSFDDDVNTVLPFRTYMVQTAAPAKGNNSFTRSIIIGETGEDKIEQKGVEEVDPSDGSHTTRMLIYPRGRRVVVESPENTTLNMYTIGGQLMRVLDVREGTNTYSGFGPGIYIVGGTRLMLK